MLTPAQSVLDHKAEVTVYATVALTMQIVPEIPELVTRYSEELIIQNVQSSALQQAMRLFELHGLEPQGPIKTLVDYGRATLFDDGEKKRELSAPRIGQKVAVLLNPQDPANVGYFGSIYAIKDAETVEVDVEFHASEKLRCVRITCNINNLSALE